LFFLLALTLIALPASAATGSGASAEGSWIGNLLDQLVDVVERTLGEAIHSDIGSQIDNNGMR